MKSPSSIRRGTLCLSLVAALATAPTAWLQAQESEEPDSRLVTVRVITVKSGHSAEFVDLQKKMTAAMKAAGRPNREVWQEVRGDTNTFHVVTSSANYAELDESNDPVMEPADWANWVNRISKTIAAWKVITYRSNDAWGDAPSDDYEPNLLRLTLRTFAAGDSSNFRDWLVEKLVPTMKKMGANGSERGRLLHGGSPNTWYTGYHFSSWAELDEPGPMSKLSEEEREELWEGADFTTVHVENVILRHRADMSY